MCLLGIGFKAELISHLLLLYLCLYTFVLLTKVDKQIAPLVLGGKQKWITEKWKASWQRNLAGKLLCIRVQVIVISSTINDGPFALMNISL